MYFLLSISGSWKAISLEKIFGVGCFAQILSKVGLPNVYLAAFEYFELGLCVFDRKIRIQHFTPFARAVDKRALGTRLRLRYQFVGEVMTDILSTKIKLAALRIPRE